MADVEVKNVGRLLGVLGVAGMVAAGGYLFSQARQVQENAAELRVVKVDIQGQLALLRAGQEQNRAAIEKLASQQERMLEKLDARANR